MSSPNVLQGPAVFEDSGTVHMARLVDSNRQLVTQAAVATINLSVWDDAAPSTPIAQITLDKTEVIFDTLRTPANSAWSKDDVGCNFLYKTLPEHIPNGDQNYTFEYRIVPVDGQPMHMQFKFPTLELFGS